MACLPEVAGPATLEPAAVSHPLGTSGKFSLLSGCRRTLLGVCQAYPGIDAESAMLKAPHASHGHGYDTRMPHDISNPWIHVHLISFTGDLLDNLMNGF